MWITCRPLWSWRGAEARAWKFLNLWYSKGNNKAGKPVGTWCPLCAFHATVRTWPDQCLPGACHKLTLTSRSSPLVNQDRSPPAVLGASYVPLNSMGDHHGNSR